LALAFYDEIYLTGAPLPYAPFEVYLACYYYRATGN
jgi:hypothetical protein